jgi:hypothetical protein
MELEDAIDRAECADELDQDQIDDLMDDLDNLNGLASDIESRIEVLQDRLDEQDKDEDEAS